MLGDESLYLGKGLDEYLGHFLAAEVGCGQYKGPHSGAYEGVAFKCAITDFGVFREDNPSSFPNDREPVFISCVHWEMFIVNFHAFACIAK